MKTVDAKKQKIGRVASEVAKMLMGKDEASYTANKVADVKVQVTNASQMDISEKKKDEKEYMTFSGYPSGQKTMTLREMIEKKGYSEVIRLAVKGMLPDNKLRSEMLKNLTVID